MPSSLATRLISEVGALSRIISRMRSLRVQQLMDRRAAAEAGAAAFEAARAFVERQNRVHSWDSSPTLQ